jgi:hypothetical protein
MTFKEQIKALNDRAEKEGHVIFSVWRDGEETGLHAYGSPSVMIDLLKYYVKSSLELKNILKEALKR